MLNRSLLSLTAVVAATAALFGAALLGSQPALADGHSDICIDRAPGTYTIDVPAVAAINQPAASLPTTVGEGGEITSMIEPGGIDLVATNALAALVPFYADVMTIDGEKVNLVDCPWMGADAMAMPNGGTGGLISAASSLGNAIPLIALGAGAALSALAAGIGIRRRTR